MNSILSFLQKCMIFLVCTNGLDEKLSDLTTRETLVQKVVRFPN